MFEPAKDINEFILKFIYESNAIEGIYRPVNEAEIETALKFLDLKELTLADLENFISVYQKDAKLRDQPGLNVFVGNYTPPKGGIEIKTRLIDFLRCINDKSTNKGKDPFLAHKFFESLHPFTDCNGRTGRIIWLWQMLKLKKNFAPLGFMQSWYYQSLNNK
jgi:Fic family protein